jgi:hypothetical protein
LYVPPIAYTCTGFCELSTGELSPKSHDQVVASIEPSVKLAVSPFTTVVYVAVTGRQIATLVQNVSAEQPFVTIRQTV